MADAKTASPKQFNMHDRDLMQKPYVFFDKLRESGCPVAHSEELGGFYYTTNYAAARRVYDDFRTFSSADGTALPKQPLPLYPIDMDPPQQTKMRKILNPLFLPEVVVKHKAKIEMVVNGLIDGFEGRGDAELQEDLVRPTLSTIFLPFLGVPMSDRDMLAHWLDFLTRMRAEDPETCAKYGMELDGYLRNFIATRRDAPPQDDVMQTLLDCRIGGQVLTDEEILGVATLVLFGGLDTSSAALGEALLHLIRTPADLKRLLDGDVSFKAALDECVRFASPIQGLRRTVTTDTVLEGCPLKAGDYIMAMNGAANHDPDKFDQPDRIDFDRAVRNEHDHLGFGGGAHICIGQHFARLLMEVVIRSVFARLPNLKVKDGFSAFYAVGESRVMQQLPVTFDPVAQPAAA
jgi:cytochrome P450